MEKLQEKILEILIEKNDYITSDAIAAKLNISSRTVRRHLCSLNDNLKNNGAIINITPGIGIKLIITNHNSFNAFLLRQLNTKNIPNSKEERIQYLLDKLLKTDTYIKLDDIAESIYISPVQLRTDIKIIKKIIQPYNLTIENKYSSGLYMKGDESDIRNFINEYFFNKGQTDISYFDNDNYYDYIKEIIFEVLHKEDLLISDNAIRNLCISLYISIFRMLNGYTIRLNNETIAIIKQKQEYTIAHSIYKKIQNKLNIRVSKEEIYYCTVLLAGDRYYDLNKITIHLNQKKSNIELYFNLMLKKIYNHFKIDFFSDKELKSNLTLHILPFVDRVKNKIPVKNPLLYNIKENYCFAYEIASIAITIFYPYLNNSISEDEISYFALYFILALEKINKGKSQLNILVVCNNGKAASQVLGYKIKERYEKQINSIQILSVHQLSHIDINIYDCIFSTVSLNIDYNIPLIKINNLLTDIDFEKINNVIYSFDNRKLNLKHFFNKDFFYMNMDVKNKEEAIQFICDASQKNIDRTETLSQSVLKRESIASTELNNLLAIPHPLMPISQFTFIAIGVLKKPIIWEKKSVQLILLISISENDFINLESFFISIYKLTTNSNIQENIRKITDFESFLNLFFK